MHGFGKGRINPALKAMGLRYPTLSCPSRFTAFRLYHVSILCNGRYRYINDLLQLTAVSSASTAQWPQYHTPIEIEKLLPFLACHPDQQFAAYIYDGLTQGFRIGFNPDTTPLKSRKRNHPSCLVNSDVVRDRIQTEVLAGRLYGPIPSQHLPGIHVSPLGLIPKAHQTNKWRLIVDLSNPAGSSTNDGIDPTLCSLCYASVDDAVNIIQQLGRNTLLLKLDIKDAYRIVPVHPADYHLLGIRWDQATYIDRSLPFGLRSAPKILTAIADFVAWVLSCLGIKHQIHYLDDFLFLVAADSHNAWPLHLPGFLGIRIDTHAFELRLPPEKLARLCDLIQAWSGKRTCTRTELESLLGH